MSADDLTSDRSANLRDWVDAAAIGGFPAPLRGDRWQPLRAGVVGLWEFDVTEYWYANGWVQLTGRNETGKSSLMALTTLIPWLADTASSNIDTLGRSGKKFRYYVEPTGADGDRRTSESSTHRGWLWVEYARLVAGVPRYFSTLLFAETRSAAADVKLSWCTVEGDDRVRKSIDLAPLRIVAAPKELHPAGWIVHPNATAYREHVATHLLGSTAERLGSVGKMLKVTRTPKLGAQLEIGFVQQHLRAALPELSRAEVNALANGWTSLIRFVMISPPPRRPPTPWNGSGAPGGCRGPGPRSDTAPTWPAALEPLSTTSPAANPRPGTPSSGARQRRRRPRTRRRTPGSGPRAPARLRTSSRPRLAMRTRGTG